MMYVGLLLCALSLLVAAVHAENATSGTQCQAAFEKWLAEQRTIFPDDRKVDKSVLIYFLHVPRTAGRTTASCLLRPSLPPSRRCAKSYDRLNFNVSLPNCGFLTSHDDWSALRFLPKEAAVVTSIRNPVDRFLSAYEFAAELGTRAVVAPAKADATKKKVGRISTSAVWPWTYLLPFFEADGATKKAARVEAAQEGRGTWVVKCDDEGQDFYWNELTKEAKTELSEEERRRLVSDAALDPYNNNLIMPLHEFTLHPIAHELLHNGQTLQVLGLTNYSHDPQAAALRSCIQTDEATQSLALDYAKERLRGMLHVATFETFKKGLATLATAIDARLDAQAWKADTANAFTYDGRNGTGHTEAEDFLDQALPQTAEKLRSSLKAARHAAHSLYKDLEARTARREAGEGTESAEELDVVAKKLEMDKAHIEALQQQLANLEAGTRVKSASEGAGFARQIKPDDAFKQNMTLAQSFLACEARATRGAAAKREGVLKQLTNVGGQWFKYSREARSRLPLGLLDAIETLNWMDMELHTLATQLHAETFEAQERSGALQDFDKVVRQMHAQRRAEAAARAANAPDRGEGSGLEKDEL